MNVKALLTAFSIVFTELPQFEQLINSTVKQVQAELGNLPGAQKLAAAEAKINTFLAAASDDLNVINDIKAILTPAINAAVAMFKEAQQFGFSKTPAAAQSPAPAATL